MVAERIGFVDEETRYKYPSLVLTEDHINCINTIRHKAEASNEQSDVEKYFLSATSYTNLGKIWTDGTTRSQFLNETSEYIVTNSNPSLPAINLYAVVGEGTIVLPKVDEGIYRIPSLTDKFEDTIRLPSEVEEAFYAIDSLVYVEEKGTRLVMRRPLAGFRSIMFDCLVQSHGKIMNTDNLVRVYRGDDDFNLIKNNQDLMKAEYVNITNAMRHLKQEVSSLGFSIEVKARIGLGYELLALE